MPTEGCHSAIGMPCDRNDQLLHLTHNSGQNLLEPLAPVGGSCQQSHNGKEFLWIGRAKGSAIDQQEVLRHVSLGSIEPLAFHSDYFDRQSTWYGHAVIENVSGNRRKPHDD